MKTPMVLARLLAVATLLSAPSIALAQDDGFIPGPMFPKEKVTLLGPGVEGKSPCIDSLNGYQLDMDYIRTGSILVRRASGEKEVINISMPLVKKAGYREPIDAKLKAEAQSVCLALAAASGQEIFVVMQEISEEDEGQNLLSLYLRELEILKPRFQFKNYSEVYAKLP